ncbi:hypothetical protein KOAAANKH_00777 [Brevundimonas sp. NIBR10]|uniref:DUF3526 domain-containing protein n=1 Tax=Brevundimonas sp. NIBR10 TaxID=3015997 RepID=UPI0022F1578D|nr:DUF3526 domain-containing protein [Brevundimonas sp. NIBR10]WGM45912.1 hypothetical protein KOAAANKH_00777 [Brevundimonas sp. NIBR10]
MSAVFADLRLLLRGRFSLAVLGVLLLLSGLAVITGLSIVGRQNAAIDRAADAQASDLAAVASEYGKPDGDAGYAAYYTFHPTWDRPSTLAFAAIGQRDIQPWILRVRLLGLQSQLYESETINPELTLPGPFDFAFVLLYLAPLVVIALMHDLVTGEREAGRLRLLASLPRRSLGPWWRRTLLRYGLTLAAAILPLWLGGLSHQAPATGLLVLTLAAALYLAIWFGLALTVAARASSSTASAMALVGSWIVLTLIVPGLASAAIARAVPVDRAIDLTLAQREHVHHGWDVPKSDTLTPFFAKHPEWRDTAPIVGRFHWKWYYAMHEAGDDAVSGQVAAYRESLRRRQTLSDALGWVTPAVALQGVMHRLADTDLAAQLAYQDSIHAFHERLKTFYYPYLFRGRPFTRADFDDLPTYAPRPAGGRTPSAPLLALALLAGLAFGAAALTLGRPGRLLR